MAMKWCGGMCVLDPHLSSSNPSQPLGLALGTVKSTGQCDLYCALC